MKKHVNLYDAKKIMQNLNVIIYGSVRNISDYFLSSFTNINILSSFFKSVYVIIFENDSTDNTRELLLKWRNKKEENIKKHLILKDDLDILFPFRATRLAYCRNSIISIIKQQNLYTSYEYAIHCDLDDRFWSLDYDSICSCFQYNLDDWDVFTGVSKHKHYYDFWALRLDNSWFNKNIFSCDANGINYESKTHEFIDILNKNKSVIKVNSAFNGMGIYKTSMLIDSNYDASYFCDKCNNINRGCFEDNDHIGLHKNIILNGGKIYINTNMNILSKPEYSLSYKKFINKYIKNSKKYKKNITLYLLKSNLINKEGHWLEIGTNNGNITNILSNYTNDKIFGFTNEVKYSLLNKNTQLLIGNILDNINMFLCDDDNLKPISLIYFSTNNFFLIKKVLQGIYTKLDNNCTIIFYKLINYNDFTMHSLKAFYEFTQEYNIDFKSIGTNNIIENNLLNNTNTSKCNTDTSFAFQLITNVYFSL